MPDDIQPELIAILRNERDRTTQRIDFLERNATPSTNTSPLSPRSQSVTRQDV